MIDDHDEARRCAVNVTAARDTTGLELEVAWFECARQRGPAIGSPERTTWCAFAGAFCNRREGEKDGPAFTAARFEREPDGQHVHRLKDNVLARTVVALDIETDRRTGEIPPPPREVARRTEALGLAVVIYTSHSHTPERPRYRVVLPLSEEIAADLPAIEVVAEALGLGGVIDRSKAGAESLFYLPSAAPGEIANHETIILDGAPLNAPWLRQEAGAILAARQAEAARISDLAHAEADKRRAARAAAGFDPDDSLIEKIRSRLDRLADLLLSHGYDRAGTKFRHPNSASGGYGADIETFGGIERVFSHNATDPLHATNLPKWCGGVTALDAFDVVTILDFGGDRTRALAELAQRFGFTNPAGGKAVARVIYRMVRQRRPQAAIEAAAYAEGARLGLSRDQVVRVANWVAAKATAREAA